MSLKTHLALNTLPAPYQKMLLAQHPELKADSVVPFKTIQDALAGKPLADTWLRLSAPSLLCSPEDARAMAKVAKKVYQTVEAPAGQSQSSKVFKGELKWTSGPTTSELWEARLLEDGRVAASCDDGSVQVFDPQGPMGSPPVWVSAPVGAAALTLIQLAEHELGVGYDDGSMAALDLRLPSGSTAMIFGAKTGRAVNHFAATQSVGLAVASADGHVIVSNGSHSKKAARSAHLGAEVFAVAECADGTVAAATEDGHVHVLDFLQAPEGEPVWSSGKLPGSPLSVTGLSNGQMAAACKDGCVYLLDPAQPSGSTPVWASPNLGSGVRQVIQLADGTLAAACNKGRVYLVDPSRPAGEAPVWTSPLLKGLAMSVGQRADGALMVATDKGQVYIFE